jgi:hypothetical protein
LFEFHNLDLTYALDVKRVDTHNVQNARGDTLLCSIKINVIIYFRNPTKGKCTIIFLFLWIDLMVSVYPYNLKNIIRIKKPYYSTFLKVLKLPNGHTLFESNIQALDPVRFGSVSPVYRVKMVYVRGSFN